MYIRGLKKDIDRKIMKEYRIREIIGGKGHYYGYCVQMKLSMIGWVNIKCFDDVNKDFAKREAEELLELLERGKNIKMRLL